MTQYFDVVVDTSEMADRISEVDSSIGRATVAVNAMQAAVILAEKEASDRVCRSLNSGFYALIRTQLEQKRVAFDSEANSDLLKLRQLSHRLLGIKDRMERDYHLLSSRYIKLFKGIDSELKLRILNLDSPVFQLAEKNMGLLGRRKTIMAATVPVMQREALASGQEMIASSLKAAGQHTISVTRNFLDVANQQRKLTHEKLSNESLFPVRNNEIAMTPAIVSEFVVNSNGTTDFSVAVNDEILRGKVREEFVTMVRDHGGNLPWVSSRRVSVSMINAFDHLLDKTTASDRVKSMARKLFLANPYRTLEGMPS